MQPQSNELPELIEGTVIFFHADKRGFGFIRRADGVLPDVFVNRIDVSGQRSLPKGQRVSFQVQQSERGPIAKKVRALSEARPGVVASFDGRTA